MGGASVAERMPSFLGSIRVRLAFLYSVLLFGLAALVVGGIYLAVSRELDDEVVTRRRSMLELFADPDGRPFFVETQVEVPDVLAIIEREVNQRALDQLRQWSFGALGALFVTSLGVGWWVSGLVLRPVGRITAVAREISATDLKRRIELKGPNDELRQLADTFDGMLGRLDEAFDSQRRFIQEASHELRNPLAVMRTNLEVTLADPDASAEELRETAEVVSRTTERIATLVDDLVMYARHGALTDRTSTFDLASVVEELVAEFRLAGEARQITVVKQTTPGASCVGDHHAVRRAAANLIDNAVRLAPASTTVTVSSGTSDGWAVLTVSDQGPGLSPEDRDRVFQRFWRGTASGGYKGSGLGLTIVRQIAEGHGGTVTVSSELGAGSTFALWLPLARSSAAPVLDGQAAGFSSF